MFGDSSDRRKKIDIDMMLAGLNRSEGKGKFTSYDKADPPTYNGVILEEMRKSDDPAFRNITEGQMRAIGGVIYFSPEFKKKHGREINLNDDGDLTAYNTWSSGKAGRFGAEPLKMETIKTLSEENINKFYIKNYFNKAGINRIKDSGVQYVIFDMCVLFGIGSKEKNDGMTGILEKTLARHFPNANGNNLFEKANSVNPEDLIKKIGDERLAAYDRIIARNPLKAQFRDGWINRTNRVTEEALSGEIHKGSGGATRTVETYSKHNKTNGINGVGDEEFFNTDPDFWKSILNLVGGIIKGLATMLSEGVSYAKNVLNGSTVSPSSTAAATNKQSTPIHTIT